MKKYFFAIAMILLCTQGVYSQSVPYDENNKSHQEQINNIDKIRQKIKDNLSSYSKTEEHNDSTGFRYTYSNGKELQQITVYYKDEKLDKYVVWYFHNSQLIYSEQIWTDRVTKNIVDYEKFYLKNEQLFAWFKFDKQVDLSSQEFKKVAGDLTAYASKLKEDHLK